MSDRFFNRDRNRPYQDDIDERYNDRDYRSQARFDWEYDEGYDTDMPGETYGGQNYGQNTYRGGYGRPGQYRGGYGREYYQDYGDYGQEMRRGGYGQGYGRGEWSGYGRQDYGYEADYDRWNRGTYGGGYGNYGRYGSGGYGQGHMNRWGDAGRQNSNWGSSRYGQGFGSRPGRDYEYDYDFDTAPTTWTYSEIWLVPGPYTGVGPQDYHRSDERILEDINERLTQHGRLNARNIKVQVSNGEVTLTGTVDNRVAKRMAEDVAEGVSGVTDVHNQLRVQEQQQVQGFTQQQGQSQQQQRTGQQQGPQQSQRGTRERST